MKWWIYNSIEYHPNFRYRRVIKWLQTDYTCENCGKRRGDTAINVETHQEYSVKITVAHLDHDPKNPDARLKLLCLSCHSKYDMNDHADKCSKTVYRKQRMEKIEAGQLELPLQYVDGEV